MWSAVPRSGDAVLLTIRDDAQALPSRDLDAEGAPRILSPFEGPTMGGSAGSSVDRMSTPRTDRNDAMRIRGQVADTGWSRIPRKHEDISVFDRWFR
jgi:hypothetical protein